MIEMAKKDKMVSEKFTMLDAGFLGIWIAGTLITWLLYFWLDPAGPGLGVAASAERLWWRTVTGLIFLLPPALWWMKMQWDNQHWRAEFNGVRYEEGKKYVFLTTKRVVVWGLGAALFIALGSVPFSVFDLGGLVIAAISILFGPVEVVVISMVSWMVRGPMAYGMTPLHAFSEGLGDVIAWAFLSFVFHRFLKPLMLKKGRLIGSAGLLLYLPAWFMSYHLWAFPNRFMYPDPAFLAEQIACYFTWYPTCGIAAAIGFVLAISLSKYVWPKEIHMPSIGIKDWIGIIIPFLVLSQSILLFLEAIQAAL
jgi:hypothetical protein